MVVDYEDIDVDYDDTYSIRSRHEREYEQMEKTLNIRGTSA